MHFNVHEQGSTWLIAGIEGVSFLGNDLFHESQRPLEVHVVAHAFGLPTEHGRVASKACLKLSLGQQIHPDHLQHFSS